MSDTATSSPLHPLTGIVTELLERHFGLIGTLRLCDSGSRNCFLIGSSGHPPYIARLFEEAEIRSGTGLQTAVLLHLNAAGPELPVPKLIKTLSGASFAEGTHEGRSVALSVTMCNAGRPYTKIAADSEVRYNLGTCLGAINRALVSFPIGRHSNEIIWDIRKAGCSREHMSTMADASDRMIAGQLLDFYDLEVAPRLPHLHQSVLHSGVKDWNATVIEDGSAIANLSDFGDAIYGPRMVDLAGAMAYAMMNERSPMMAACDVLKGYHAVAPLDEDEIACLFPMIAIRLCFSLAMTTVSSANIENTSRQLLSQEDPRGLLKQCARIKPEVATALFRRAIDLPASPGFPAFNDWLSRSKGTLLPSFRMPPANYTKHVLPLDGSDPDLSFASSDTDHARAEAYWRGYMREHAFEMGIGLWHERRNIYRGEMFRSILLDDMFRDLHLGIDIFLDALEPLYVPFSGVVVDHGYGPEPLDYGGVILLRHAPEPGVEFYSLWGHLDPDSISGWNVGDEVAAGTLFARLGDRPVNGGWLPHLHFQLSTIRYDKATEMPGVGEAPLAELWAELYPDPAEVLLLPPETFQSAGSPKA